MKKLILSLSILFSLSCIAQNVKVDSKGNYVAISNFKADSSHSKESGHTYTDNKNKVYKVFISAKGKLFVKKISKAGNEYNYYLNTEAKK